MTIHKLPQNATKHDKIPFHFQTELPFCAKNERMDTFLVAWMTAKWPWMIMSKHKKSWMITNRHIWSWTISNNDGRSQMITNNHDFGSKGFSSNLWDTPHCDDFQILKVQACEPWFPICTLSLILSSPPLCSSRMPALPMTMSPPTILCSTLRLLLSAKWCQPSSDVNMNRSM